MDFENILKYIIKTIIMTIVSFILVAPFVYPELSDIDFHFKPISQRDLVKSNFEIENSKNDSIKIPSYSFVINNHFPLRKKVESTINGKQKKRAILLNDYKNSEILINSLATKEINPSNHDRSTMDSTYAINKSGTLLNKDDLHNIKKELPKQNDKRLEPPRGLRAKLVK